MPFTKLDLRQTLLRSAQSMIGSSANAATDTIFPLIDAELAKLFEDRNVLLTQGGLITYTGTQVQFGEALKLEVNSKVAGGAPVIIDLGSTTRNVSASGRMIYAVINRTAGTATITDDATTLPAVTSANQEVFLIAKRQDAGDGTKRLYLRNGMALNEGQTARLGASGTGGTGAGLGDDINTLRFQASFADDFSDSPSSSTSAVNNSLTTAAYSAAGALYRLSYDASKTVTGTGTSMTLSATPAYTVAPGDMLVVGTEAKRITAVATQTSYTIESAFSTNPSAAAACVSQAVHTLDLRSYTANSTGLAISAVISDSVSTFMLRYRDSAAVNDTVWDFPGAALVASTASADNSNWTSVFTRVTALSTLEPIRSVTVSGSQFLARFFSAATSGSGAVNILDYKAFLHESAGTSAGTTMNQAYCLTSGAGSSVNCSVSSATGKTRITTSWAFATGVNPGTQQGQIMVMLDGKVLPRYIDGTLTASGYYKEISGQVIELDADYSGAGLEVDVKQWVNAVDTTSQNSTNLSYLQDMASVSFQGFVDESSRLAAVNGAPGAGQFRSSITNRASIPDLANDLKVRMGVDRIMTQSIYQLQNEFGPNGEPVWAALNDDRGLIRFVGSWSSYLSTMGPFAYAGANTTDYLEITFYGTGLNILTSTIGSGFDYRATVDNGSEGSSLIGTTSTVLNARNYSINMIVPVTSGLTLGVHTVKIRNNNSSSVLGVYGFEVLNESANVNVRPGTAYTNGKKLVSSAASSVAYNGGTFDSVLRAGASTSFSSTRGARVLTYIKSDGTIGKSAYLTNSAAAYLSSADHTYEDIARTYHWREFGAGRSDDFSTALSGSNNLAFTLDDGTATLVGSSVDTFNGNSYGSVLLNANGSFITITFVGTGLDFVRRDSASGGSDNYTVQVDGGAAQALASAGITSPTFVKVVSGLPYGTHTVKINRVSASTYTLGIKQFIVYQPKKPSLPAGAVELADYNVMADFVANSTAGLDLISTGVLKKAPMREMVYSGTWAATFGPGNYTLGFGADATANNSYVEYSFFGTGAEWVFYTDPSYNSSITVSVDGLTANTTNYPSATFSVTSPATFNSSTGVLSQAVTNGPGRRLRISGLSLGFHKIRMTAGSASLMSLAAIDIITPIHSHVSNLYADLQNTLPVGSESISDNRQIQPIKNVSAQKAWAQAVGVASDPTTTSTSFIPCPDMSVTLKTTGAPVEIVYSVTNGNNTTNNGSEFQIFVNGLAIGYLRQVATLTVNGTGTASDNLIVPLSTGVHKIDLYWRSTAGANTSRAVGLARTLKAREL